MSFKEYKETIENIKEVNTSGNKNANPANINSSNQTTNKSSFVGKNGKYAETDDLGTNTCFSTDAEQKFKSKYSISNFLSKQFTTPTTKFGDLGPRFIWAIVMIVSFITFIVAGPFYCSILVLIIMSFIYSELIDLNKYKERNLETTNYHLIAWYFFYVGMYFFNFKSYQKRSSLFDTYNFFIQLSGKHYFICFILYCFGILIFLRSLTKGYYKYQFRSFAYIQIIVLVLSLTSSLIISNLLNGMLWFLIPSTTVIVNDISAYIWGRKYGKTQLTEISPKKTLEGFIGAFISTLLFSILITEMVLRSETLVVSLCQVKDISLIPFSFETCDFNYFTKYISILGLFEVKMLHLHTFFISLFSSSVAPLGGFFASGFKRAIKIKDFSDTIPGHGGFTDRMDCQILAGIFTYVWLQNFVLKELTRLSTVMSLIDQLSQNDKLVVFNYIKQSIGN